MFGLLIILVFYLLGQYIASLTGNFIPGSVIGMALLFVSLILKVVKPGMVRSASRFLTANMMLFFIPIGVGLVVSYKLIFSNGAAIIVASLVSTVLVIVVVGIVAQKMEKKSDETHARENQMNE